MQSKKLNELERYTEAVGIIEVEVRVWRADEMVRELWSCTSVLAGTAARLAICPAAAEAGHRAKNKATPPFSNTTSCLAILHQ
jgi:hypothetical protein